MFDESSIPMHPLDLLDVLLGQLSPRKLRLIAAACCSAIEDPELRAAASASEALADGELNALELQQVRQSVPHFSRRRHNPRRGSLLTQKRTVQREATELEDARAAAGAAKAAYSLLQSELERVLLEVSGNPFRPSAIKPEWLTWNNGTVPRLARTIYEDRRWDLMPILGDALEDALCDDAAMLEHCRGPGPHVRGCWVVDLILGKK